MESVMQPTHRPHLVPIARFLADVTVRSSGGDAVQHPMDAILAFVRAHPNTDESIAVMKATMAIIDCWGAIHESDILTLSDRSLSLLSQFGNDRLRLRYSERQLVQLAAKLTALISPPGE